MTLQLRKHRRLVFRLVVGMEVKTAQLLVEWQGGSVEARNVLIARLHPELSTIAAARLRAERGTSLSTGDLINESVMRIAQAEGLSIGDRTHMLALASRVMPLGPSKLPLAAIGARVVAPAARRSTCPCIDSVA